MHALFLAALLLVGQSYGANSIQRISGAGTGGGGGGGVTSVALTAPSFLSVSGSPITTSGTFALSLANTTQNYVFAGLTSGTGLPAFRLLVASDIPSTLNGTTFSGVTKNPNGLVGAPSYSFASDATSGMWLNSGSGLAFSYLGISKLQLNTSGGYLYGYWQGWTQLFSPNGSASAPGYSFISSQGTGMYSPGTNQLGLAANGAAALTFDTSQNATFYGSVSGHKWLPVAKTASYTLVAGDSGKHFTNAGASGAVTFTLPTPSAGLTFTFKQVAGQTMTVTTPSGVIQVGMITTGATRTLSSSVVDVLTITCEDGSNWSADYSSGTITLNGAANSDTKTGTKKAA